MHHLILHNDQIVESSAKGISPGQTGFMNGWGVFTTMRVHEGVLFAWERHWKRMQRDARLMRVPFPEDPDWLESRLLRLVKANQASESTLRMAIVRNRGGAFEGPGVERAFDLIAFTTELRDWGGGARLGVVPHARHAANIFAGTKILSWAENLVWYEKAHEDGYDEVVLLNERDEVSECTSANIFVVEGTHLWTPPLSSGCLPGVTRELLIEGEVAVPGLKAGQKTLHLSDLTAADEVIITSSTRDAMPVVFIEGLQIRRGAEGCARLKAAFHSYLERYTAKKKAYQVPVTTL